MTPPIPPAEQRNAAISIAVTEAQKQVIEEAARRAERSVSSWARYVLLNAAKKEAKT